MPPSADPASITAWLALALGAAAVALLAALLVALRRLERRVVHLERLGALEAALQRLSERDPGLDLRRVEHVLIDVRDALGRLEERLLAVAETRAGAGLAGGPPALVAGPLGASAIVDRVLQRLVALGYERIQVVTKPEAIAPLLEGEGSLVVEARRDGVPCKGRVHVARGYVGEIEIQPAYSAFP